MDSLPRSTSVSPSKEELFLAVVAEPCTQATASASAHWASDGASPTLDEIPELVLRLLLEARLPAATAS